MFVLVLGFNDLKPWLLPVLLCLLSPVSVALSKLDNKQELIKKLKDAKLDKIKNIATATLLTGDTSVYQREWETIYF